MDRKYWALVIPALEPDFATAVRKLEDRGLAGVAVPQVYGSPFVPLAAAAVSTTRLELATGIAIGLTRSPFETAVTSLDLDRLSKGRFILGLGTGPKHWTNGYFGMPYEAGVPSARGRADSAPRRGRRPLRGDAALGGTVLSAQV